MPTIPTLNPYGGMKVAVRRDGFDCDAVNIRVAVFDDRGRKSYYAKPIEFEERDRDELIAVEQPPTISVSRSDGSAFLTSLMDQLWALGIRPSDIGTPGHLAATQAHLADFRAIVAKQLDLTLPTHK